MKNTRFILGIGLLALIGACKKPDTTTSVVSPYPTYSSLDTIYQMLEIKPKYVTLNGATGGTFYGTSGTRYIIPPNCLQYASGNPVTTNVQFEVAEYLKKGDMIFSKMLPVSDDEDLISAGEVSINASVGGVNIYLKPGCTCQVNVPQAGVAPAGMSIFSGLPATDTSESIVNWRRFDSITVRAAIIIRDTTKKTKDTLAIVTDSLKWMNLDMLSTFPNPQEFEIKLSASGASLNNSPKMRCYIFVDTMLRIARIDAYKKTEDNYQKVPCAKIPIHIVAFGLIDKKFYGAVFGTTPITGSTYSLTLTEVKPEDFKSQLNNLTK